jgi:hypothetical protein
LGLYTSIHLFLSDNLQQLPSLECSLQDPGIHAPGGWQKHQHCSSLGTTYGTDSSVWLAFVLAKVETFPQLSCKATAMGRSMQVGFVWHELHLNAQ